MSISDGLRDEARIHERLLGQLPQPAGRTLLSPAASAELFRKVSGAYREHDLVAARLSQELHVEIERSRCVMARLRQITTQLLGSAGTAPDVAAGTDLEHLSGLIAGLFQERESEERFRALTETALDVSAIVSPDGRVEYASPSIEQVIGYLPAELLGTSVLDRIHTQNVSEVRRELQRMARMAPSARTIVARFQHRDGSWRVLLTNALGAWVLEEACRQNREWQDAGLPCLPVAVNLSAEQFRSGALVDEVKDALARSALQGNLFSKPLAADFAALLRAWDARTYASRVPSDALHPFIAV